MRSTDGSAPSAGDTGRTPLYQRLADSIRARIREGVWAGGEPLPSERDLSDQYKMSRSTVRQALEMLERSGLLARMQGRGTFVAAPGAITQPLEQVTAFRDALAAQGLVPALRLVTREQEPSDLARSRLLSVPAGAPLLRLVYLGLGDGEPMAVYTSDFPAATSREAVDVFCEAAASGAAAAMPVEHVAQRAGLRALRMEQTIEARLAGPREAALLSAETPAAVFEVTSLVSDPDGRPLEYRRAVYRADRYRFNMERALRL